MRNPYIDRLRGFSIAAVMMLHYALCLPHDFRPIPSDWILAVFRTGYYGVSVFFVVSGFLITGGVLRHRSDKIGNRFSIGGFYVQRLGRILPCLVLMISLGITLSLCGARGFVIDQTRHSVWQILNYVFTFRFNTIPYYTKLPLPWQVLWSLSIEEVFYLSFPILLGPLKKSRWIIAMLIVITLFGPCRRASAPPRVLYDYFSCFDLIALGSLTAFVSSALPQCENRQGIRKLFRWMGMVTITVVYFRYPVLQNVVLGPSLIGLGAAIYLLGSANAKATPSIQSKVLRLPELFGRFSYELYLFHFFIIVAVAQGVTPALKAWNPVTLSYVSFGAVVFMSFLVSAGIAKVYSEPANKLIRRVFSLPSGRSGRSRPLPDGSEPALG
jgi:peptidoglycan/LPS O-acetylase OafA/YrhL